jgi:hypothetical protein
MKIGKLLRLGLLGSVALGGLVSAGCTTPSGATNNTGTDALVGGGAGAVAGGLLGAVAHAPAVGAVLGGALGATTGAAIGNSQDRADQRQAYQSAVTQAQAAQAARLMTPPQVVDLVQKGVDETIIINQIRTYGSVPLSPDDLAYLNQCRVSSHIVGEMQAAAARGMPPPYPPPPPGYWRGRYYYPY